MSAERVGYVYVPCPDCKKLLVLSGGICRYCVDRRRQAKKAA